MAWVNNFGMNLYGDPSLKILPPSFTEADSGGDGLSDNEEQYIYLSLEDQQADINGGGSVDAADVAVFAGMFGQTNCR